MPDDPANAFPDSDPQPGEQLEAQPGDQQDHSPLIRVGCADLPPGLRRRRYFERLPFLEVGGTMFKLPKASVLRRWTDEAGERAGERGRFGLLAPQVITHKPGRSGYRRKESQLDAKELAGAGWFGDTDVVKNAVEALAQAAERVNADVVVFRSPADFSPSANNRDRVRRFFTEIAAAERFGETLRVWEPQGLWEPDVAARLASDLDVVYACDPLSNDPIGQDPEFFARLPQRSAYFRLTGLGRARQRFDEYDLSALLETISAYDRVWIVFAHDAKYPDAINLVRLLQN